ncbi:MAG: hypothetical protein GW911_14700 [Armatimonadetes bacterium]|nr:hypothetical protein [Armatimonadota bacterium]NCO91030.1 hypothetical protein [Armatimonadota bacterium]NCP28494.1 hypothetical protein [Armatimonadota bacterium]NCQ31803.1 hypothetical protein [Armatimonadota bacterium]NDK13274.1 hypothetical protein [Armatimonadota bacterium]
MGWSLEQLCAERFATALREHTTIPATQLKGDPEVSAQQWRELRKWLLLPLTWLRVRRAVKRRAAMEPGGQPPARPSRYGIAALCALPWPVFCREVNRLLGHPSWLVRWQLVFCLRALTVDSEFVREGLQRAVLDRHPAVRKAARLGLGSLSGRMDPRA